MSSSAKVFSFQDIEDFRIALIRFQSETLDTLRVAWQEVQRTLNHLEDCQRLWQTRITLRQDVVKRVRYVYEHHPSPENQGALRKAMSELSEAEENLSNVRLGLSTLQQAVDAYQHQAQPLSRMLQNDVPKATALLSAKVTTLYDYATGTSVGHSTPLHQKSISTTVPTQGLSSSGQVERSGGDVEREPNKESLEGRGVGPERR